MHFEARIIPVDGVSVVPGLADAIDYDVEKVEARRRRAELLLLNAATALSVLVVCSAWIALVLE